MENTIIPSLIIRLYSKTDRSYVMERSTLHSYIEHINKQLESLRSGSIGYSYSARTIQRTKKALDEKQLLEISIRRTQFDD